MTRFNFTHNDIMAMPFKTFLAYQAAIIEGKMPEDPELAKWRAEAETWQRENNPSYKR